MTAQQSDIGEIEHPETTAAPKRAMTVGDAKTFYSQFGRSLQADHDQLVFLLRASRTKQPLPNANYLHALSLTDAMLRNTQSQLRMITGGACGGFLRCLEDSLRQMLTRFQKHSGLARIIVINGNSSELHTLAKEFAGFFKIIEAKLVGGHPFRHFIVGDADMVREEEPHPDLDDESNANLVKASVYFSNPTKGAVMSEMFDSIWQRLERRPSAVSQSNDTPSV